MTDRYECPNCSNDDPDWIIVKDNALICVICKRVHGFRNDALIDRAYAEVEAEAQRNREMVRGE
jgi:hypothetical protein